MVNSNFHPKRAFIDTRPFTQYTVYHIRRRVRGPVFLMCYVHAHVSIVHALLNASRWAASQVVIERWCCLVVCMALGMVQHIPRQQEIAANVEKGVHNIWLLDIGLIYDTAK